MSTSSSTWSGITLVLVPPCATVGANVVCVHVPMTGEAEGQLSQRVGEVLGVEQRVGDVGVEVHAFDEQPPRLVDLRLRLVLGDAAHHLGGGDQGVVGAERLGAVAGRAVHPDLRPERALLRHQHRQARTFRVGIWNPPDSVST